MEIKSESLLRAGDDGKGRHVQNPEKLVGGPPIEDTQDGEQVWGREWSFPCAASPGGSTHGYVNAHVVGKSSSLVGCAKW